MQEDIEEWKPVIGWEGFYEVSNQGRLRRMKAGGGSHIGRILRPFTFAKGYLGVDLRGGPGIRSVRYVHALVAEHFIGPRPPDHEVNHINGDKSDPRVENLEYVTVSGNSTHAFRLGLSRRGSGRTQAILSEENVVKIISLLGTMTKTDIGKMFGVHRVTINNIVRGISWRHVTGFPPLSRTPPEHQPPAPEVEPEAPKPVKKRGRARG